MHFAKQTSSLCLIIISIPKNAHSWTCAQIKGLELLLCMRIFFFIRNFLSSGWQFHFYFRHCYLTSHRWHQRISKWLSPFCCLQQIDTACPQRNWMRCKWNQFTVLNSHKVLDIQYTFQLLKRESGGRERGERERELLDTSLLRNRGNKSRISKCWQLTS